MLTFNFQGKKHILISVQSFFKHGKAFNTNLNLHSVSCLKVKHSKT